MVCSVVLFVVTLIGLRPFSLGEAILCCYVYPLRLRKYTCMAGIINTIMDDRGRFGSVFYAVAGESLFSLKQ